MAKEKKSKRDGFAGIRRDYGHFSLSEETVSHSPFEQFELWFEDVLKVEMADPTAMVLSTVDKEGHPDSRIVLLKGLENESFIFYTNYQSPKSLQLEAHPYAALNFYWPQMARQVRIRGSITRVSEEQSDSYFASRPIASQISAVVSPQSDVLTSRFELEEAFTALFINEKQAVIPRPEHWGGYQVHPFEIEFWQGRDNRLHDRILYQKKLNTWSFHRLAP